MKNERYYPGGKNFGTSAGSEVEIRAGGRRETFVLKFSKPVEWVGMGIAEFRRFHALIGRHLRLREGEELKPVAKAEEPEPS